MPIPSDQLVAYLPWDVIMIIASVICAIACMQLAGGMDYLVHLAEKALRKNPKHITFAAPVVTYLMTMLAGTGHTAFSTLPVIAEVAKEQGIRPSRPLSIAVVASQIAITASPISAAVVAFSGMLEPLGVDYLTLLAICIPSSFIACLLGAFVANMLGKPLEQDEVYLERKAKGLIKLRGTSKVELKLAGSARRARGAVGRPGRGAPGWRRGWRLARGQRWRQPNGSRRSRCCGRWN